MHVHVRLFAALRERAGADGSSSSCPTARASPTRSSALEWLTGGLRVVMAVNREYADADAPLHADDELALIPPVSGGAGGVAACPRQRPSRCGSTPCSSVSRTPAPARSSHSSA